MEDSPEWDTRLGFHKYPESLSNYTFQARDGRDNDRNLIDRKQSNLGIKGQGACYSYVIAGYVILINVMLCYTI